MKDGETSSLHASEQRARLRDDELDRARALIAALQQALLRLESMASSQPYDFAELAYRHREVLIALSFDQTEIAVVFEGAQDPHWPRRLPICSANRNPAG